MAIETKLVSFSIEAGLAQILAYMLVNPNPEKPNYRMIATGGSFIFVKLVKGESPRYSTSDLLGISNRTNNLYQFRLHRNDILKEHQECNEDNLCLNA
ncbi:hypothetical protein NDI47_19905 [Microcoleus vaginatus GB1-A2]|uniref:hypothetical protein n=1 Tax=Microcoleus vaginatus TaxID=119532 RepID=UPI00168A18AD|nr:hypothetical protein [Microcoleus sp. FACHB-61]